ncbi:acyl-CoA dehydrogenase family protein [Sphingomonas turrisvirgatae]|uniref:Acyl-CoA dehydrogenase n=1 Tax=Sphingomonas turrisvirgatae TaxID=1888892 RepID=A0A1E3LXH9_9SPHN|nr:acyl-CoA dehydrogenase family protein [Sphingomonas turrisvirgatae]ODP38433.1 acyl-CoA dehydrogenase [Sphingomonas turrisvirgatae]
MSDAQRLDAAPAEELLAYRARARAWLAQHAPAFSGAARAGLSADEDLALGRAWQRLKSEHGYACITLPRAYGGGGGSELEKIVFGEEELKYDLPTVYFGVSLGMPVPMMLRYATPEVAEKLLPPAICGDDIWCQLFSEPAAGSDLAALRMRATPATRGGVEGWLLNGQKVWTSWAQYASWGIIVARSDPAAPKHAGLTFFYLDMRSPGVEVRQIRKLAGETEINEVFFNDVFVPDSQRMGPVGAGFRVAIETLMIERYSVSDESLSGPAIEKFVCFAQDARINGKPALEDGEVRALVADTLVERQGLRSIHRRALEAIGAGREPGPEGAIRKLLLGRRRQQVGATALDLLGPAGAALTEGLTTVQDFAWSWIDSPGPRIAGGTDEILRNTIAEKVLGLPQDHRPDKGVPFNQPR